MVICSVYAHPTLSFLCLCAPIRCLVIQNRVEVSIQRDQVPSRMTTAPLIRLIIDWIRDGRVGHPSSFTYTKPRAHLELRYKYVEASPTESSQNHSFLKPFNINIHSTQDSLLLTRTQSFHSLISFIYPYTTSVIYRVLKMQFSNAFVLAILALGTSASVIERTSKSSSNSSSKSSSKSSSTKTSSTGSLNIPTRVGSVIALSAASAISGSVDLGNKEYDRGQPCNSDADTGSKNAVFILESGATLSNVIIGANALEGVHCKGPCTLKNVWFRDVCEGICHYAHLQGVIC